MFFPIERLYIDKIDKNKLNAIFKTNVTPTFVLYKNNIEIGRISGCLLYTSDAADD